MDYLKRTWAQIDLDAISHNYGWIRRITSQGAMIMSVVKADAYGHGAAFVARHLESLGSNWFAVSNILEAMELRCAGVRAPILIFGSTPAVYTRILREYALTPTVSELEEAAELSKAATEMGHRLTVHIKLDTGMSRMGFPLYGKTPEQAAKDIADIAALPGLYAQGIYTHFAAADYDGDADGRFTKLQYERFMQTLQALKARSIEFEIRHCCNSAGIIAHPGMHLDMVRAGISLYGLSPSTLLSAKAGLRPAMSIKTVIVMLKNLPGGATVSYGRTYEAAAPIKTATLPIGYADGYLRMFGNKAHMIVNGKRVPVIGRVCMDQCVVDVTGIDNLKIGQVVTVAGREGNEEVSIDELSSLAGTINYQTVCLVGKRVPRVYFKDGRQIGLQSGAPGVEELL